MVSFTHVFKYLQQQKNTAKLYAIAVHLWHHRHDIIFPHKLPLRKNFFNMKKMQKIATKIIFWIIIDRNEGAFFTFLMEMHERVIIDL